MFVTIAGMLHDIGKPKFKRTFMKKGPLTLEQFLRIQGHVSNTVKQVRKITAHDGVQGFIIDQIAGHHQRPDGRGYMRETYDGVAKKIFRGMDKENVRGQIDRYLNGKRENERIEITPEDYTVKWGSTERYAAVKVKRPLAGNEIPFISRILSVADAFDAMTADRPYRPGMPVEKATEIITQERGKQFDDHVADSFLGMLKNETAVRKLTGKKWFERRESKKRQQIDARISAIQKLVGPTAKEDVLLGALAVLMRRAENLTVEPVGPLWTALLALSTTGKFRPGKRERLEPEKKDETPASRQTDVGTDLVEWLKTRDTSKLESYSFDVTANPATVAPLTPRQAKAKGEELVAFLKAELEGKMRESDANLTVHHDQGGNFKVQVWTDDAKQKKALENVLHWWSELKTGLQIQAGLKPKFTVS
ncbi:HD domain-containing protein [Candidatus Micrarchaeota archaeon]|nr:HD domain-containing protein [Candidatus Micrarchaeota archaeon]